MSLLLDALKKSGEQDSRAAEAQARTIQAQDASKTDASRTSGENLFAAKRTLPGRKFPRLGIVHIALIAGGLFALGWSAYIYIEITPPNQRFFYSPPSLPAAASAAKPQPVAAASPAPIIAAASPIPVSTPPVATTEKQIVVSPRQQNPHPPRTAAHSPRPRASHSTAETPAKALDIQRTEEPNLIDALLADAYLAYQSGDYANAWQRYRAVLAQDHRNRDALLGLAAIALQQGQDSSAIHYYRQVLALDPRDPVAQAGLSYFGNGDPAGKEVRLKQLIAQQPDSSALHFALGNQYVEQSRWSDAKQAYANALSLEPTNALFAFNVAVSLDHLGLHKTAAQYYQQALQFDRPGNAGFNHAQVERRLKELTAN